MKAAFTLSQSKTKSLTALFLAMVMICATMLTPSMVSAQTYEWGSVSDNSGSNQNANPFGRFYGWEYHVFLYPANTANFNGKITQLEFLPKNELTSTGGELDIWMKEVTLTDLDANTTFAQYQANATLVYHTDNSPAYTADTYVALPLQATFMHDESKSILVLVRSVAVSTSGDGSTSFYYKNPDGGHNLTWYGKKDSNDPGTTNNSNFSSKGVSSSALPVIRWTYVETPAGCNFWEDFEGITGASGNYSTGGTLPDGWHRIYGGTTATGGTVYDHTATTPANMPHVHNNSSTPGLPSSGYYLGFYSNSSNTYSYAIMPPFAENMAPSHISFKYKLESANQGALRYGVITGTDASTFVQIGSDITSASGTISVDLNTSQTLGKRICFLWYKTSTWYTCGIDDICVELTRVESVPTNLAADNITTNSAEITWNGNSDSYTVWYGGQEQQTLLSEGFEGGSMPSGWSTTTGSSNSNYWTVATGHNSGDDGTFGGSAHSGNYNAATYKYSTNTGDDVYLISPAMDLSAATNATLTCWYMNPDWSGDTDGFGIYYRTSSSGSWNELLSTTSSHTSWTSSGNLSLPSSSYVQIGFKYSDGYGYGCAVDDVVVTAMMSAGHEVNVVAPPCTLTGLRPNTTYQVKVKGENTAYCTPISFTTLPCTLTVQCSPAAGGTATASANGPFNEGDQVTLTATPAAGYVFKNWTKTGTGATFSNQYDNPVTLTIGTANVTATANFVAVTEFEVGTNEGTSYGAYLPTNCYYNNSLTQQIYYPDEIGHTGTIQTISFYHTSNFTDTRNLDIYMSVIAPAGYPSSSAAFMTTTGTKVFSGNVTFHQGWNTIVLTSTFLYSNIDNYLMITVDDNTGNYTSSPSFATFTSDRLCSLYKYDDDNNLVPSTPPTPNGVTSYKNYIKLGMTTSTIKNCYAVTAVADPAAYGSVGAAYGTGTNTYTYIPFASASAYSFVEQIYPSYMVGGAGTINSISFYLNANSSDWSNEIVVYMKNVLRSHFASTSDYEPVTASDMVYMGTWTVPSGTTGWVTIDLTTPFTYDGTSNLLVAIDENTAGSNSRSFRYTSQSPSSVYPTIRFYGSSDIDPYNISSTGTRMSYRANVIFGMDHTNGLKRMYANGGSCTVTASPKDNYLFENWTENSSEIYNNTSYTLTVNDNHNLVANFKLKTYDIIATANPSNGGTVSGAGTYNHGATATLTATANPGYTFTNWTKNGTVVSTNATYSFMATAAGTYVANFQCIVPTNLAASNITSHGATLSWTGTGNIYNIELGVPVYTTEIQNHDVLAEGFENNGTSLPSGWTSMANIGSGIWTVKQGDNGETNAHSGTHNAYCAHTSRNNETFLITPMMDLSNATSATLTFWMKNRNWGASDIEECHVYYRVDEGSWTELWSTTTEKLWEEITITLEGLAANYQLGFTCVDHYGYGLCIDDIVVNADLEVAIFDHYNWTTISTNESSPYTLTGLTPNTSYQVRISNTCGDASNVVSFTTLNEYTVNVSANPSTYGIVSGGGNYDEGSNVTITATPETGYDFIKWTENDNVVSNDVSYTISNIAANHTLVAHFQKSYIVTASADPTEGGNVQFLTGDGSSTSNEYLPCYSYYNYNLTQQIYTPAEIGAIGSINSIAFYNGGSTKTLSELDFYMVHTDKSEFSSTSDWITVTSNDLVYSGTNVEMTEGQWTIINFTTPFVYDGVSNLALITDEHMQYSSGLRCRVFTPASGGYCSLQVNSDGTNYDPYSPTQYSGTLMNVKNQILVNPSGSLSRSFPENASCTLIAEPNEHYHFTEWTENGSQISTNTTHAISNIAADHNVVANFELDTYEITASANPTNGGTITGADTYSYGAAATLIATPSTGYHFVNWTENGDEVSTNATYSFTVTGARTIVANFTPDTYTITATASPAAGGTVSGGGNYNYGDNCTVTATANTGYTFDGWYENNSLVSSNAAYSFTVTAARTLEARYTLNSYTITATASPTAGGTITGDGTYNYGDNCTLTATPNTGYTFDGWYENNSVVSTNAAYSFTVTAARTLEARYTQNQYVLTINYRYSDNSQAASTYTDDQLHYNDSYSINSPAITGYTPSQATVSGTMPDEDVTVNVTYNVNSHNVTYAYTGNVPTGAPAVPATQTYNYGATVPAAEVPTMEGYTFSGWSGEVSTMPDNDVNVTGYWTVNTHTLTINYVDGNNNTLATQYTGNVDYNDSYSVNSPAVTGYTPDQATVSGTMPDNDVTVNVTYTLNSYAITATASPAAGGTVSGNGTYNHGDNCTVTATANTGYTFDGWYENNSVVSTSAAYTFTVTAARTLEANFSCVAPSNLTAGNITPTSATLNWEGEAESYNVRYRTAGNTTTNGNASLIFSDDFESGSLSSWTTIDADGNGHNWTAATTIGNLTLSAHSGSGVAYSQSYDNNVGDLSPNNWLITPQVQLGGSVSFWAVGQDPSWSSEHFAIYVSTTGTNPADFTSILSEHTTTGEYVQYTADLSDYSGLGYVAIRHFNCSEFILNVDDFELYGPSTPTDVEWITVNDVNNNSLTLNELTANTEYEVQVQSTCNTTTWSDPVTFTTLTQQMDLTVTGGEWTYDGTAHTATVVPEVTEGTTLWYRTSEEDEWSTTEPSITNVGSITVYVKATHADYSDATGSCTLTVNPAVVFTTDPMPTTLCSGNPLNVEFDASIAGNNGTMSFAWTRNNTDHVSGNTTGTGNIDGLILTTSATQTVTFSVTPTFTPTVGEPITGAVATFDITVNAPAVSISEFADQTICDGESYVFRPQASGNGTLSYSWTKDGASIEGADTLLASTAGTYAVTVTATIGNCTVTESTSATLTINNPTHVAFTATACGSYTWTSGNGETYTESGNYTYSHTDANGCTQVDTLHLTVNNPTHVALTETACGSYTWTAGNGTTYTASGNYTYEHEDANGCTQVDTLHLTVNNVPSIADITAPAATGHNTTLTLTAPAVMANGSAISEQGWQMAATENGAFEAFDPATPVTYSQDGYYIRYTASNECGTTYSNAVRITVNDVPVIASIVAPAAICSGNALNMGIPAVSPNGSAVTAQGWQISADQSVWADFTNGSNVTYSQNGYYIKYFATNGCGTTYSNAVSITVKDAPAVASVEAPAAICAGSTLSLTAPTVTANGSTVSAQGWQMAATQNGTFEAFNPAAPVSYSQNGYYIRYTATSECGTTNGNAVQVTVKDAPAVASVEAPAAICAGNTLSLSAPTVTANGSTVSEQGWQMAATQNGAFETFDPATALTYSQNGYYIRYTAISECGTTNGNAVQITVNPLPAATLTVSVNGEPATSPVTVCAANSVTLTAEEGYNYSWTRDGAAISSTGNVLAMSSIAAEDAGSYAVTLTDVETQCAATSEAVDISVNALPAVSTAHTDISCTELGTATITVTNGGAPLSCLWNDEVTATLTASGSNYAVTFSNLEEGEYTFVVTNTHGCTAQGSVVITNPVTISASQSISSNEICANSSATVTYHIAGGSADYTLEWVNTNNNNEVVQTATASTADGTHSIADLPAGSYSLALFITDVNGCNTVADEVVELTVWPARNTVVEINVTGGATSYEFNGQTYPVSHTPEDEHYTDIHGCDSTVSYMINSYPLEILIADRCTMTRSSYTKAYANTPHILYGDTIYVTKNSPTTFYAYIQNTDLTTWNDQKMDMSYELRYNEEAIANADLPSIVSNFSISTYYDRSGQYYGIPNLTAATGEIPNNTLAFRQTANSTILHFDYFYFDAFKNIPNQVTFTPLESGTYTLKLMAELRNSTGGTNRNGIYNPYIVGRKYGHLWGGYGDRPGEKEVIAARSFTIIVNENGAAPSGAPMDVNDYAEEASVTIFPNPASDQLNIVILGMEGATSVTITDARGKVVRTINTNITSGEEVLTHSVADFAQGIYFINVRNSDNVISKKFVVTRQ